MLSKVEFHSAVDDVVVHTTRLLRKAYLRDARVTVVGFRATIERLDTLLWTQGERDFLPHLRWTPTATMLHRLARTPIWLVDDAPDTMPAGVAQAIHAGCTIVVNLGADLDSTHGMTRLIEVVSNDPADRQNARRRWRAHEAAGRTIEHHPMNRRTPATSSGKLTGSETST